LRAMIRKHDPKAFVNIVETVSIMGDFRKAWLSFPAVHRRSRMV